MKKVTYLTESAKKFTKEEAIAEAKRCLLCEEAYCNKRCPINSNPKEFVKLVATEQFEKAIKLIRDNNPLFYSICTRVCPYDSYCVGGCRKSALGDNPIMIPFIQKYLVDYCDASDEVITSDHIQPKKVGQKVAIIGSGPAGLAAAAVLGQKGYEVTVFEAKKEVGGWLSYGIPPHRLPKEIIQKDLKYIKSLDVEFRTSCMVGRDITLDDLKKEGFKSFLISTGFTIGRVLNIEGHELDGVTDAVSFLSEAKANDGNIEVGESAVIIGGGDVAMDCGTTAKLTGYKKVRIMVRNSIEEMTASAKELKYLQQVGVPIIDWMDSVNIVGKDGKVVGMEFKGTDDDTKLYVECDKVIFAVGQMPGAIQTIAPVDVDERGMIVIDEDFNTSVKGVFAAGDISKAKADKTACYATALGKKVAESIDKYMQELEYKVSSEAF